MLQTWKNRAVQGHRSEDGFTLVELMVVVLIIAVLLAIAIPTFLGSQGKSKDRATQSALRNTITSAKTVFVDTANYTNVTDTALRAAEPSLSFLATGTASTGPKEVSVNPASSTTFYAAAKSASGSCFYIKDDSAATVTYATGPKTDTCSGTTAAGKTFSATGW